MKKDADGRRRSERVLDEAQRRVHIVQAEIAVCFLVIGLAVGLLIGWWTCP